MKESANNLTEWRLFHEDEIGDLGINLLLNKWHIHHLMSIFRDQKKVRLFWEKCS